MKTYTAYQNAKSAFDCWLFSLYLKYGFEQGKIPDDVFNNKLEFISNGKAVISLMPKKQKTDVIGLSNNLMSTALGACFLTFDESLNDIFGEKPDKYGDNNDLDSLRAIIYMIRCAFAHNPSKPIWRIDKQKYKRLFNIKDITLR